MKISETEELVDREKKLDQLRWDWMEAVSYTHLDVYKRQIKARRTWVKQKNRQYLFYINR